MRRVALCCIGTLIVAAVLVFVLGGFYNLTATRQHPLWVFHAIGASRDTIIALDAAEVDVPADFAPAATPGGAALYQKHCVQCHGAPGVAPQEFALGMMPVPSNLVGAARDRPPEEIYWFIRYGLKMSGMPAWDLRMAEADMWRVTAFVEALPTLSPAAYAALVEDAGGGRDALASIDPEGAEAAGDPELGRLAMQVHACPSCHVIPGIVGPRVRIGPPLDEAAARRYIAGVLPNTRENMVRWITDPQEIDPLSAMPDLGVPRNVARDMAAYLYDIASDQGQPDGQAAGPRP